jgi:hypothetical protein
MRSGDKKDLPAYFNEEAASNRVFGIGFIGGSNRGRYSVEIHTVDGT